MPTISPTVRQTQLQMYQQTKNYNSSGKYFSDEDSESYYYEYQVNENNGVEGKRAADNNVDRSRNKFKTGETSLVYTFKDFMSSPSEKSSDED